MPDANRALQDFSATRSHVLLNELDRVRSRIEVLTPGPQGWQREPLAGLSELVTTGVDAADPRDSDEYFLQTTGFLTPNRLLFGRIGEGAPEPLKELPSFFDSSGLEVTQHEARSTLPVEGAESGLVVEVMQKGYRFGEQLIRPARIVVSA